MTVPRFGTNIRLLRKEKKGRKSLASGTNDDCEVDCRVSEIW